MKASGDLKKVSDFLLPYISGSSLPMALKKKDYGFRDIQDRNCKNPTQITLTKILDTRR